MTIVHNESGAITPVDIFYDSPLSKGFGTNLKLANYMNSNACGDGDYGFNWTQWLAYSAVASNGAGNPFAGARNHYEYTCDGGAGTVARVRLLVRDFDSNFFVNDFIERFDLFGPTAYPLAGRNPMDDGSDEYCAFGPCNNRRDLDNYYNSGTCGAGTLDFNFPAGNFPQDGL